MAIDKQQEFRDFILRGIRDGIYPGGSKLPGSRELVEPSGCAFTVVQTALNSLVREGILYSVPRQGTYVREDWDQRILPENLRVFCPFWEKFLYKTLPSILPQLRPTHAFQNAAFEIRFTNEAIQHQQEYQDLSEFVEELYPNCQGLYQARINEFRDLDGKLFGLPLIFSPWVICCNREIIEEGGGWMPSESWDWEELSELIRALRKKLPPEKVFAPFGHLASLLTLYFHLGGETWDREKVKLNTPESLRAIRELQKLREISGAELDPHVSPGKAAITICTRADITNCKIENLDFLPLPRVAKVPQRTLMGGSLLCVRRMVSDFDLVRKLVRYLLSDEFQTELCLARNGFPIRKQIAAEFMEENTPLDRLMMSEMPRIVPTGFSLSPAAGRIFTGELRKLLKTGEAPENSLIQLQSAVEMLLKYKTI